MVIYGASGHGKVLYEIAKAYYDNETIKFADDKLIGLFMEIKVINPIEITVGEKVVIAIGNNKIRKVVSEKFHKNSFETLVHPKSFLSCSARLGVGTVMMAGVSINADAQIGEHVILNTNCSVDHDCVIGNFVHISPNVALAGNVIVDEGTHVGIGSSIIQGIKIGRWVTIGAGSVVIKDIPDFAVVVGNPARVIKFNNLLDNE